MAECWLYKAFHCTNASDKLLYVGISDTPSDRMTQHSRDKWWWHLVNRIEWFKQDSRERATSLESSSIVSDKPLFNRHQSTRTSGSVLCGCLELVAYSFEPCPLCLSACRYTPAAWDIRNLCTVDIGERGDAHCFEVRMSCGSLHSQVQWTQLVPISVLCDCETRMPLSVLGNLWAAAQSDGEISEDIPELRAPTLAEMFCQQCDGVHEPQHVLIEAK